MTTSRLLPAIALLTALAACELGGGQTRTGADATCVGVAGACTQNSQCCSYGCVSGRCVANPVEGGTCRTTNDCASGRLCKSGTCTTPTAGMCRDTADVCTSYLQCCSGNCEGASCTQNNAPRASAGPTDVADVPYRTLYTLQSTSTDPDGDPLSWGWSFVTVPPGSGATITGPTSPTATFTPDQVGTYQVKLVVTDGPTGAPNRLTSETTIVIHVVNRAPEPTATATGGTCAAAGGVLSCSRSNVVHVTATARDPDGDALECAWRITEPGGQPALVGAFATCTNPSSASLDYTPAGEGTYSIEYVVRDHDQTSGAIVHADVPALASFVSRNDPPVPVVSRTPYYANMGATAATTPAVPLDASASTDPNGDHLVPPGPLSFFWEMVSWPGSSDSTPPPAPQILGFATATPTFVPQAEGDHVLKLTVSDAAQFGRASASASTNVTVRVGRYVQPLGHTVADAARAAAASPNIIVLAGKDPADATKGMIWVYDTSTGIERAGIPLVDGTGASGIPRLVDVTPDGTKAVVVDEGVSIWVVNLSGGVTRYVAPFAIGDLVISGNRFAFLYKSGGDDYLRELDLTTGAISQPAGGGYSAFGAAGQSGSTSLLYRVDAYFGDWYRYALTSSGNNNSLTQTASVFSVPSCGGYPAQPATAIWGTLTGSYVVSSCGQVYNGTTLADLQSPLGVYPSHVDSTSAGAILACEGTSLTRFDAALGNPAVDVLTAWSQDGWGRTTYAAKAFFNADGSKRIAVVHDTATPVRYGIVTFP